MLCFNFFKNITMNIGLLYIFYTKHFCMVIGSMPKYFAVGVPYRHDRAFSKRAHTLYIFPAALKRTFKFFSPEI